MILLKSRGISKRSRLISCQKEMFHSTEWIPRIKCPSFNINVTSAVSDTFERCS